MPDVLVDLIRVINVAATSVSVGFSLAIAWNFRHQAVIPPYIKVMGASYTAFAVFSVAVTQDALRQDRPLTWITWLGLVAALTALISTVWAWWSSHQ